MKRAVRIFSMFAVILCGSLSLPGQNPNDKLIDAIDAGKAETLRSLLAQDADINAKDDQGYTPLQHAVMSEQVEAVSILLKAGADPEIKSDAAGYTALHWAAMGDNLEILRTLFDRGANLEAKANNGFTPLLSAVYKNKPEAAALLVSKGANLEARDSDDRTPLLWAARNCPVELVKLLLDRGANLEAVNKEGGNALDYAKSTEHADMTAFLQERFAALAAQQELNNKMAPAITEYSNDKLILLLDAGADIEAKITGNFYLNYRSVETKNVTPLLLAIGLQQTASVELLLARHADYESSRDCNLEIGSDDRYKVQGAITPLMYSIQTGQLSVVQQLVGRGANLERRDQEGRTPLIFAIDKDKTEIVKFLLKKGVDPAVKDNKGQTALQHAALQGDVEIGKLLQSGDVQYRQLEKTPWKDAQEQFKAYIGALSTDPQSVLLRHKVIELGAALPAAPIVPDTAKQFFSQASQQLQQAKTPSALETPIALLRKTVELAPWWGNAYYNLGVALQMNSNFDEAITMYAYYLTSKPSAADAAEAQTRILAARTAKDAGK